MVGSGLNLLTGEYRNTLDEKGRILFPTKLRTGMADNVLVVTQAFDRCLCFLLLRNGKIYLQS